MVKWPFRRLSDLQLGDKRVTLNHLDKNLSWPCLQDTCMLYVFLLSWHVSTSPKHPQTRWKILPARSLLAPFFVPGGPRSCPNAHNNQTMAWVVFGGNRSSMDGTAKQRSKDRCWRIQPKKKHTQTVEGPSQKDFSSFKFLKLGGGVFFFREPWQSRNVFWTLR